MDGQTDGRGIAIDAKAEIFLVDYTGGDPAPYVNAVEEIWQGFSADIQTDFHVKWFNWRKDDLASIADPGAREKLKAAKPLLLVEVWGRLIDSPDIGAATGTFSGDLSLRMLIILSSPVLEPGRAIQPPVFRPDAKR